MRVRQALEYGYSLMGIKRAKRRLGDDYIRKEIEEAVEKLPNLRNEDQITQEKDK